MRASKGIGHDRKKAADQLSRTVTALNKPFAAEDVSPTDADRWRELKRHIIGMKNALELEPFPLDVSQNSYRGFP